MSHDENILCEPRALWCVGRLRPTVVGEPAELELEAEAFRNGSRHPIILTHMLIGGVGYTAQRFAGINTPATGLGDFDASEEAIERCSILVRHPQRYAIDLPGNGSVSGRRRTLIGSLPQEARHDIPLPVGGGIAALKRASGITHLLRWTFDRPLRVPRGGAVEFGLGAIVAGPDGVGSSGLPIPAKVAFYEDFGAFGGSARYYERSIDTIGDAAQFPAAPPAVLKPSDVQPPWDMVDGLGQIQGAQTQLWPGVGRISGKDWRQQETTRSGATQVSGFGVAIDQRAYSGDMARDETSPFAGLVTSYEPASVAFRLPTRAKTVDGGSGEEWWRQGAPLALVSPSQTPARVIRLPKPIRLPPGDRLAVELESHIGVDVGDSTFPFYQIGVSFTGYAEIRG